MAQENTEQLERQDAHFDVAIVGGGMVGISLALLLAEQQGLKILLIESQSMAIQPATQPTYSPSFDARSTALSWASRKIYQSVGLWDRLQLHLSDITQIHVSDRGHGGLTRMTADDADVEALGYVVENRWLGSVLLEHLNHSKVEVHMNTEVAELKPLSSGMQMHLKGGDSSNSELENHLVEASLVVIADGAESQTAQKLGIYSETTSYNQTAIIANVELGKSHNGIAYERFTDQGPMALLPLADYDGQHRSALVWARPTEIAEQLMASSDADFLQSLQKIFGYRLGRFKNIGERGFYPLALGIANEQVRRNVLLMGNSAHSLHPVAGQGFNLSLRDAAALASIVHRAREGSRPLGSLEVLEEYYQEQLNDQRNTLMFSDSLTKSFGRSSSLAALGRNAGLLTLDLIPGLRQRFARFGMGMSNTEAKHG
ncbi:MAG: 2-octaprenyl-6-methoxyphenyl hydroxylase [Porticoccaceae bacterium]|nr:2-octaprenyl-6-methoxyphenyl hydroxylase [Porticoccaceae bacterium]|tara:strand:- start:11693 stop:12979 length:1287 start_codon:yes stop_codon:yes gene_type:complete